MLRSTDSLREIVEALFADEAALYAAVVADGWPLEMVEEGFELHRRTWDAEEVAHALRAELLVADELDLEAQPDRTVVHYWPALPGAGVTPVLYGYLLGIGQQLIKPSSSGVNFGRYFCDVWGKFDDSVALERGRTLGRGASAPRSLERLPGDGAPGHQAGTETRSPMLVVSGSDETIAELVARYGRERVTGYGHRVSGAVVVGEESEQWLEGLATDVVMWHQRGCFSARGVVFVGAREAGLRFAEELAESIAQAEERLDAMTLGEGELAARMQRLGRAEFETRVWRATVGWVELREWWNGEWISPHAVSLTIVEELEELREAVAVEPRHLQGIAVGAFDMEAVSAQVAGALRPTRICRPGELQGPEASWPHDGRPNSEALTRGLGRVAWR